MSPDSAASAIPATASDAATGSVVTLADLTWSKSAPKSLRNAAAGGDRGDFALALQRHLRRNLRLTSRARRRSLELVTPWFAQDDGSASRLLLRESLATAADGDADASNSVTALLDAWEGVPQLDLPQAVGGMALLSGVVDRLEPALLLRLWLRLVSEVRSQAQAASELMLAADAQSALLCEVLSRGAIVGLGLKEATEWHKAGRAGWRQYVERVVDDAGFFSLISADDWCEVAASIVRTTLAADAAGETIWNRGSRTRLKRAVRRLAALQFLDGPPAFLVPADHPACARLLVDDLARAVGCRKSSAPRRLLKSIENGQGTAVRRLKKPRPSAQSDAAKIGLLRSDWAANSDVCLVAFDNSQPQLMFNPRGTRCFAGTWRLSVSLDGVPVEFGEHWKCDCWFSDRDGDFIELSYPLPGGGAVIRQVMLARRHSFLVLMDGVRGVLNGCHVEVESRLPLVEGVTCEADGVTRELQLVRAADRIRCFPVSLPWDRVQSASAQISATFGAIILQARSAGATCVPIFFDWTDPAGAEPAESSPLTVVEGHRTVGAHEAVAGRLRVGDRQWMYLHNLASGQVPRTVLGHHTLDETVIAEFRKGDVRPLVHVEGHLATAE
jgi:hypothetical protein